MGLMMPRKNFHGYMISATAKDGGKGSTTPLNTRNTVIYKNCIKKKTYRKLDNGGSHDA